MKTITYFAFLMVTVHELRAVAALSDSSLIARPTVLVTGSTDGIGVTTANNMAAKGYNVLIHGRSQQRVEAASKTVRSFVKQHSNDQGVIIFTLPPEDISTVSGCERLVKHVKSTCEEHDLKLSVLMNNAGVYVEDHIITEDGLEQTFAVNVLAPFVITSHLLPTLLQENSRIVIASSISQCRSIQSWEDLHYSTRPYSAHGAYSESKLLDAMLTMEFASRLKEAGFGTDRITCNCLDPGTVNTKMLLAGWGRIGIEVEDALDETWLCTDGEVESITGQYFTWKSARHASGDAYDEKERVKMWEILSSLAPKAADMWTFDICER
jgi:NAD(P)-dependent dehydrogenase (short-subunit alcohol dehydrogenase family)